MKFTIAFLLVVFGISAILSTPAPVPKKLKWAQHKALFSPEEEAARRKAHLAKSDKNIPAEHHGNQNGTFNKQNHAKIHQGGKNRGGIESAGSARSGIRPIDPHITHVIPVKGKTNKPTTMKPTTAYPVKDQQLENAWAEHKDMFKLSFHSAEEEAYRKAIFTKTDKIISKHNRDPNTTDLMDHNKYSTLTDEEKQTIMRSMKSLSGSGASTILPGTPSKIKDGHYTGFNVPSSIKPTNAAPGLSNKLPRVPQDKSRANPNVHHHKGQNNAHGGGIKKATKKGLIPQHD